MKPTSIENGERHVFEHPSSGGIGGLVTINGATTFAYPDSRAATPPTPGSEVTVGGVRYMVTTVKLIRSPRMHKLGLSPIAE